MFHAILITLLLHILEFKSSLMIAKLIITLSVKLRFFYHSRLFYYIMTKYDTKIYTALATAHNPIVGKTEYYLIPEIE